MKYLCNHASAIMMADLSKENYKNIHKSHYTNIKKKHGPTHLIDNKQKIAARGDWFIQGRVEAAFTSAFDMAYKLLENI